MHFSTFNFQADEIIAQAVELKFLGNYLRLKLLPGILHFLNLKSKSFDNVTTTFVTLPIFGLAFSITKKYGSAPRTLFQFSSFISVQRTIFVQIF